MPTSSLALDYFRSRGAVIFLSYCRFWEPHPFVQQSLAKKLTEAGVKVYWFDGVGFEPYRPTLYFSSPHLHVKQMFRIPGDRFAFIRNYNVTSQASRLNFLIKKLGNPVIWVQGGFDEAVLGRLPYIDIYSTFDDFRRHAPCGVLCSRARTIFCQNDNAYDYLAGKHGEKCIVALPPVELDFVPGNKTETPKLPEGFPTRRMGFVGSLLSGGFDFELFEKFLERLPEWGFILQGRTDEATQATIKRLSNTYENFHYFEWARPGGRAYSVLAYIEVTLLLYPENETQAGAFPVKVLESLHHGIPCVATKVAKTRNLEGYIPRESDPEKLIHAALAAADDKDVTRGYEYFRQAMDPLTHLQKAASSLAD